LLGGRGEQRLELAGERRIVAVWSERLREEQLLHGLSQGGPLRQQRRRWRAGGLSSGIEARGGCCARRGLHGRDGMGEGGGGAEE
jgi:hypothetical protein